MPDEKLIFSEEIGQQESIRDNQLPWKIIISDDEEEVHAVTRMVLHDYSYDGRPLKFMSAFTEDQTVTLMKENPDTAVLLIDVVMDRDDSGLNVVKRVRDELKNKLVRIILRTGQPGQAPEKQVISEFDINDYKEKTELTAQKLFTTITAALRAYRDLNTIEMNRMGLEHIVVASADIFEPQSIHRFSQRVLTQLGSLFSFNQGKDHNSIAGFAVSQQNGAYHIIAGTGSFSRCVGQPMDDVLPEDLIESIKKCRYEGTSRFIESAYIGYYKARTGKETIIYYRRDDPLNRTEKDLVRIFSTNIAVAFDNLILNQEIEETQKEVIFTLGAVVDGRSHETGNHVKRVGALSEFLASKAGLSHEITDLIKLASSMHDLGKIGIPDSILNKPARLTKEEFETMKKHTIIGHNILKGSNREILKAAAIIALEHHEYWNGCGYPRGLKGEDIHILGRITIIADVFDALSIPRVYKEAWSEDRIHEYFTEQHGKQFDPHLCKIFLDNFDEFYAIRQQYPDDV